jgi:hypothetical protein
MINGKIRLSEEHSEHGLIATDTAASILRRPLGARVEAALAARRSGGRSYLETLSTL